MRKLTLPQETKQISINGHVFDILISDADALAICSELAKNIQNINQNDAKTIIDFDRYMDMLFTKTLGENALSIISGGKPVNLGVKLEWYTVIFQGITQGLFGRLVEGND